jgi:VWFA-related protein
MMRDFLSTALFWTVIACGLGLPLEAQDESSGRFGEVIDVRVVNLEVVVTEEGVRVTGLRPDDFILTVDGEEVAIEYFTEVLGGSAVLRDDESGAASIPALAPGEAVGTSYLLFLDDYFSEPTHRNRLIDMLIAQLPLMNLEDRMAIVAYDGKRVEMLSTWSQSVASLTRVLEQAKERPAYGLERREETRSFDAARATIERDEALLSGRLEGPQTTDSDQSFDRLGIDQRQQIALITDQVKRAVLAATTALRTFGGPPGRRVFMLASGGWPNSPAVWMTGNRTSSSFEGEFAWGMGLYGPLIETANRLSYTVYPVDVPGLRSLSGTIGAGTEGIGAPRGLLSDEAVYQLAARRQQRLRDRNLDEDATLTSIAGETGGIAFLDAASLEAFERIVEDTRTYYWIGFTPNWQGDDADHRVVVKTRTRGLDARSRQSFSDLSRQTEVSMMVESSLLFGSLPGAAPLVATFGAPERAGRGKVMIPLRIEVPLAELTFLPVQDGWRAEMELHVAVQNEKGETAEIPVMPLTVQGKSPPREGQSKAFYTPITMRKRQHVVVVSLYDQLSGKMMSTRMEVDPRELDPPKRPDRRK